MNFKTIYDIFVVSAKFIVDPNISVSLKVFIVEVIRDLLTINLDQYKNDKDYVQCLEDFYTHVNMKGEKNEKNCF